MEEIIFYWEWLSLPKAQFRLLAMIAVSGGTFEGNLTDMCNYLSVTPQSRNREKIKTALKILASEGYIEWEQGVRIHYLKIKPREAEIKIPLALANSIIKHDFSPDEQVAWEQVLKLYIWIVHNDLDIVKNKMIAEALSTSESTVCSAKNVLAKEYEAITKRKISDKLGENYFITLGQELRACAWWKDISK